MEYTGRKWGSLAYLAIALGVITWGYFEKGAGLSFYSLSFLVILFLPLQWRLGEQYDRTKHHLKEIQREKEDLERIVDNSHSYLCIMDEVNKKMTVSSGIEEISGYPAQKFEENYSFWLSTIHPEDKGVATQQYHELLLGHPSNGEMRILLPNGQARWIELFGTPIKNDIGKVVKIVGIAYDITIRKDMEDKVKRTAYSDSLTGLPNLLGFHGLLKEALIRCTRNYQDLAVMYIDIDRFKLINDTMGHGKGNQLLIEVSKRLKASIQTGDIVARQSGDEFLLFTENVSATQAENLAATILASFKQPFKLEGEELYLSASIGISLDQKGGQEAEALVQQANTAMYAVKKSGKNHYQFYTSANAVNFDRRLILELGLRTALKKNELELYYQPNIELKTGRIYGVETLLRWNHPELGWISPSEFIPIAEETGVMVSIGDWVLHESCKQMKKWHQSGIQIKLSVNISILQFENAQFVEKIKRLLQGLQLSPEFLVLEITENLMQHTQHSSQILKDLKSMGVSIAIDDFGTGYSSLNVLSNMLVDSVKIDKSFIHQMFSSEQASSLFKTIMQMGKNMHFSLIAEGIETEEQAQFLIDHEYELGQGYLYSHPLPVKDMDKLLKQELETIY